MEFRIDTTTFRPVGRASMHFSVVRLPDPWQRFESQLMTVNLQRELSLKEKLSLSDLLLDVARKIEFHFDCQEL